MKEIIEKKNILPRTAVKALINGFVSYGILLLFIFLSMIVLTVWAVDNNKDVIKYDILKYTLPSIAAFIIFFFVRVTCRLSTFDLFKNCKIEKDEINNVCTKMNFFYICLIGFSVITIIIYLMTKFSNDRVQISRDIMIYSEVNSVYAQEKESELIYEYEKNKSDIIMETMIVEIGLLLGIFSLIPKQKKLIERYN